MSKIKKIVSVNNEEEGLRVDQLLAIKFPDYSRNYLTKLIKSGEVKVNKETKKSSFVVKEGDLVEALFTEKISEDTMPQKIKLDLLFEDENVIVVNKPAGMVVHPGVNNAQNTLVNALLGYYPKIKEAVFVENNLVSIQRSGIVHRLDKDTSGVLITAKNRKSLLDLAKKFKTRKVEKTYLAICCGWPKEESGALVSYLGRHPKKRRTIAELTEEKGRKAISYYKAISFLQTDKDKFSLIEFKIKTGRTHQIRVQANFANMPILGDTVYTNKICRLLSKKYGARRQMLHAKKLVLQLPNHKTASVFEAPLSQDFKLTLDKISSQSHS